MANQSYYTLLSSLPHIDSLFNSRVTPISRYQLDRRLSMLSVEDQKRMVQLEELLHWDHLDDDATEASLIQVAERLRQGMKPGTLRELLDWRLDMRTAVAALRRKQQGEAAPSNAQWSYGTRYEYIRAHWGSPTLGLGKAMPWLPKVAEHLQNGDCIQLEKTLLQAVWDELNRLATRHQFEFEAVVIYVLRWNLVARWTSYDTDKAQLRFRELIDLSLGEFKERLPGQD